MSELINDTLCKELNLVPYSEFSRVLEISGYRLQVAEIFANMCRLNALYMIACAGSGHIGSSFSSLDMVSWLILEELSAPQDIFFSSKGHDVPGFYAALMGIGRLDFELIHKLRRLDGLPGHPDIAINGIETNTGSLGMGISKAKGIVTANRKLKKDGRVFVMTGDGELQEGQFWESLISAANNDMHEITAIVDHNKLQSDMFVNQVSNLGNLQEKLQSFGWFVRRVNGHSFIEFEEVLQVCRDEKRRPKVIIADTIKGRGVSFMEHTAMQANADIYRFHSGAPDPESYRLAVCELKEKITKQLNALGSEDIKLKATYKEQAPIELGQIDRLIPAYSNALLQQAEVNQQIVALDADLALDTGLLPFRAQFPGRFFECGIAEQDMVSQAGGMALMGLLPIVHSFACFLSSRPNEQIYNNATECTKIIYVGSLAGILPGGPGHSHQSIRDISTLGSIPTLEMIAPCNEKEVGMALDYCVSGTRNSSYLRLESIPCNLSYQLPDDYVLREGQGVTLRIGLDAVIFGYGPTLLEQAIKAADILLTRSISLGVVNLPWLNRIDPTWLFNVIGDVTNVFTLDNHYLKGGQGEALSAEVAKTTRTKKIRVINIGITDIPSCGTNDEVLIKHQLDAVSLSKHIISSIS